MITSKYWSKTNGSALKLQYLQGITALTLTPAQQVVTLSKAAAELTRLMDKGGTIASLAKKGKTPFTEAWEMILFTAKMMPTTFGAIAQMTRSMVVTTRFTGTKVQTTFTVESAMIRSQVEINRRIACMAVMAMI
ncbi:hypothetical protein KR100_15555 [Synechococcus sp. KORDI-100]|nr:hypothetical protein KR100_15555 [Synechococcus sp. KORDI-100]